MPRNDVVGPLRVRQWWIAAVVVLGVIAGVLVGVVGSPTVTATETALVVVQPVTGRTATDPDDVASSVVGLAETAPVLDVAATGAGVPRDQARDDVDVTSGGAGIVTVTASAETPEMAARLATTTTDALAVALVRSSDVALQEALRPLQEQQQTLSVALQALPLGDPRRASIEQNYGAVSGVIADRTAAPAARLLPDGAPVLASGRSWVAGALAAIAAIVVLAGIVGAAAWIARRRTARRDPAPAGTRVDGPQAVIHPGDDAPAVLTRLYADAVRGRGPVLVLQLSDTGAIDLGRELVGAAEIVGERVERTDLTPGASVIPPPPPPPGGPRRRGRAGTVSISSLRCARVDGTVVGILRERQVRAAIVAVDTHRPVRTRLADAVSTLEGLAVEVRGVVVWRGRFPTTPQPAPTALPPGPTSAPRPPSTPPGPPTTPPPPGHARPTTPSTAVPSGRPSPS